MSEATPSPDPQQSADADRGDPTAPPTTPGPASWAPPDSPAAPPGTEPDPWRPHADGDALTAPGTPPTGAEPGAGRRSAGDGRITTVLLSVFTALVVAVCGCLGVGSLLYHLPADPFGEEPVAEEPQQVPSPAAPEEDEPAAGRSTPAPTPTRKPASTPSNGPGRAVVVYEVTGQGPADIQYQDADGYLVQLDKVRLPWRRTIRTDQPDRSYVWASKADDKGGRSIACAMTVDGGRPVTESADDSGWRVSCGG